VEEDRLVVVEEVAQTSSEAFQTFWGGRLYYCCIQAEERLASLTSLVAFL
jgi:hypothetical protein